MSYRDPVEALRERVGQERRELERAETEVAALEARVASLETDASGLEAAVRSGRGQERSGRQLVVSGAATLGLTVLGVVEGLLPAGWIAGTAVIGTFVAGFVAVGVEWRRERALKRVLLEVDAEIGSVDR